MIVPFPAVKRSLYRAMSKVLPKNAPDVKSILTAYEDENFMKMYGKSNSGKPFFRCGYSCEQFSYCVFASEEIINEYQTAIPVERRHFLMDATFKICPFGNFTQILIIYVAYLEKVNINIFISCQWNNQTNVCVCVCVFLCFSICSTLFRSFLYSCRVNDKYVMNTYFVIYTTIFVHWKALRS